MEQVRRVKTNSFNVLGQRQPSNPTHEVILINPFNSWTHFRYRNALENLVKSEIEKVNQQPDSNIRLIWRTTRLDINDIFLAKGQDVFEHTINKLVSRINGFPNDPKSLFNRKRQNKRTEHHDTQGPVPIIFVVHSVGLYIAEAVIPRITIHEWVGRPVAGIILLDGDSLDSINADYIVRLGRAFQIQSSNAKVKKICERFTKIDAKFNETLRLEPCSQHQGEASTSALTTGQTVRVQTFRAWLSDNPSLQPNEQPAGHDLFRRLTSVRAKPKLDSSLAKIGLHKALIDLAMPPVDKNVSQAKKESALPPQPRNRTNSQGVPPTVRHSVQLSIDPAESPSNSSLHYPVWDPPSRSGASSPSFVMSSIQHGAATGENEDEVEDDSSSIISIPRIASDELVPIEVEPTMALAHSFWTNGEFANALALLERSLDLMIQSSPPPSQIKLFEIHMQIAVMSLYCGEYDKATQGLEVLKLQLDQLPATATDELKRWNALTQLHCGHYSLAAKDLKALSVDGARHDQISEIRVLRDLALASGLLGRHNDAERHIKDATLRLQKSMGLGVPGDMALLRTKSWSIQYTGAYIDTLWGDYDTALVKVLEAFHGLKNQFGKSHLKTLLSATLSVQLLAYTGRYNEAEEQCRKTMELTDQELGQMHPLNLEIIEGLVYILRSQSRLTEALETAKSLCRMTDAVMGQNHPQAFRARSELAATHLAIGNYHTAESEIRRTVSLAKESLGKNHPETLRFCSELSHVLCYYGALDEAMRIAIDTLDRQRKVYSLVPLEETQLDGCDPTEILTSRREQQVKILGKVLDEIHLETASFKRHPSLVSTLEVIAFLEARNPETKPERVERILQAVVWCRRKDLGPDHAQTLLAKYQLASAIRDSDHVDDRLYDVHNAFYYVWRNRSKLFGPFHPDTLSAEREIVMTDCVRGKWEHGGPAKRNFAYDRDGVPPSRSKSGGVRHSNLIEPFGLEEPHDTAVDGILPLTLGVNQWADIENVSETIFKYQEAQLGELHPETLKSLLWLFSVQLAQQKFKKTPMKHTWRMLRLRLRNQLVQGERLVEALRTEERVALIFADQAHYDVSMGILFDVLDITEARLDDARLNPKSGLGLALEAIIADVREEMEALRPHMQRYRDRLHALDRSAAVTGKSSTPYTHGDEVAERHEAYHLCKCLFGKRSRETLASRLALAEARWNCGRETEQRKAFTMVAQMRSMIVTGRVRADELTPEYTQSLRTRHDEWAKVLSARGGRVSLTRYESTKSGASDEWMASGGLMSSGSVGGPQGLV